MPKDQPRRNPNQRSYHLDDETVALLDAKAKATTLSQSAIVRLAIRAFCNNGEVVHTGPFGTQPAPDMVYTQPAYDQRMAQTARTNGKEGEEKVTYGSGDVRADLGLRGGERNIVVPDPRQEIFKVPDRFVERGAVGGAIDEDEDDL